MPVLNSPDNNILLDLCLPHFGTLFGLTEDAIAIILIEMGLLKSLKNRVGIMVTEMMRDAWDDLIGEFKVKSCIEVSST